MQAMGIHSVELVVLLLLILVVALATCWVSFMVKLLRAYGGCLGANRR